MLEEVLWLYDPSVARQWHHKVHLVPAVNTNNWDKIDIMLPHQYQRDVEREMIEEDLRRNYAHVELENWSMYEKTGYERKKKSNDQYSQQMLVAHLQSWMAYSRTIICKQRGLSDK